VNDVRWLDHLDALPLLEGLTHTQRVALAGVSTIATYEPGHRLFDEHGSADRCWVVLSGCVVVDALVPPRGHVALQSIGAGELVGWSWFVPPYRWHFGATVVSPTRAAVMDAEQLRALAGADPEFGYRLSQILVAALLNRLQTTRMRLLELIPDRA
jgi:CRP/FNR family cyclic AMP-dependent transcriptional regulator